MRQYLFLSLLIITICNNLSAQGDGHKKLNNHFQSFNTVQLLNGSSSTSLSLQTVNGWHFGRLFAGIGVGYDYYFHQSVPLFAEPRFTILKGRQMIQLFAQGGCNFPSSQSNNKYGLQDDHYKAGKYYGVGADCLLPVNTNAVIVGIGFSSKQFNGETKSLIYNPVIGMTEHAPTNNTYTLNRFIVRVGWMF